MQETILLVGHGSRHAPGNEEIEAFAQRWQNQEPQWHIEVCFIELAEVLLDEGLAKAAQRSERVIVVPLILNAAGHVKVEIPEYIAAARRQYPQTEFIYMPPLGACDAIFTILKRRLQQAMRDLDHPDPTNTGVILLGRGSSDAMANGDVSKMARWLQESTDHRHLVDIAFTGITYPRLETVVQRQVRLGMMQLIILPYYLFTGVLIERIQRQVQHLKQQYPQIRFSCGDYFGFEDEIFMLVSQRVKQADTPQYHMPCDGCPHKAASEHVHHHTHRHHHH